MTCNSRQHFLTILFLWTMLTPVCFAQALSKEDLTELAVSPSYVTSIMIEANGSSLAEALIRSVKAIRGGSLSKGKLSDSQMRAVLTVLDVSMKQHKMFLQGIQDEHESEFRSVIQSSFPPSRIYSNPQLNSPAAIAWAKANQAFYIESSTLSAYARVYQALVSTEMEIPYCKEEPEDGLVATGMAKSYRMTLRCLLNSKSFELIAPPTLDIQRLRNVEQRTRLDARASLRISPNTSERDLSSPFSQFENRLYGSAVPEIQQKFSARIRSFHADLIKRQSELLANVLAQS